MSWDRHWILAVLLVQTVQEFPNRDYPSLNMNGRFTLCLPSSALSTLSLRSSPILHSYLCSPGLRQATHTPSVDNHLLPPYRHKPLPILLPARPDFDVLLLPRPVLCVDNDAKLLLYIGIRARAQSVRNNGRECGQRGKND